MITSQNGIEVLKRLEGFRSDAYQDEAGVWTIGYGITKGVKPGDKVTRQKAEEDLKMHLQLVEHFLNRVITAPLNQNQFDALALFVYNVGESKFLNSQTMQIINHRCYEAVPGWMQRWIWVTIKGEKVQSEGLINRRLAESDLWNKPIAASTSS